MGFGSKRRFCSRKCYGKAYELDSLEQIGPGFLASFLAEKD